ncbi:fibroblast growth factor receptor homolog 1 isoform X2 [Brienomyrus brachyistius]|uniref:fibroblast growth factor receptor homolog 1 isoform X2 n=1 Tax=Brienomyrus brachyistius TaxID=42636 RepID=UPI0020B45186|nr:fibroblast growth factor receptor homolog 1 isoform X2 [Brienomyrus brachyistius]
MGNSTKVEAGPPQATVNYILGGILTITVLAIILLVLLWIKKYRTLLRTIQDLRGLGAMINVSPPESPITAVPSLKQVEEPASESPLKRQRTKTSSRLLWKPPQQGPRFTKADLNLQQLIKAGKEGVYYKAKMNQGTCKGHSIFTCKITKEGIPSKRVQMEVSIMKKLVHHRNVLQLLDWNITEEPYVLLMEFVNYGTLRNFLQLNQETLHTNKDLQHLFTIASYHIALAMEHLHSKMVVHCDLALRNILVHHFPMEVKLAEFGLARDLTRMRSHRSSRKKTARERVPLRWYPPEFFKNNYYSFKGDVWAFGILLWEMHTFGTLPYPSLETSEEVVYYVCAGQRNTDPEGCRPEILQMMKDCWLELHSHRPSFTDIVRILDNILENDSDYVDVDYEKQLDPAEP